MTIEEALKTAIQFENEVRDVYIGAVDEVTDPVGKRVFTVLANEEQGHVDYLENCLTKWRESGVVESAQLDTAVPSQAKIAEAAHNVSSGISGVDRANEIALLGKALEAERKTSSFYRKMVAELSTEGQKLFQRFVSIEEGHLAIVQAELDSLTGTGAWFDILEIKL